MLELNKIYCADSLELMKSIPDKSIDLVVTSPPYDNLRTYEGFTFDFGGIAKELFRVMKTGGVVVWVVGDATINGSETGTSFKQALYFMSLGFRLHDTMIYRKINPIPLTHNRYEQGFEYMFCFSVDSPNTFNAIMESCQTFGNIKNTKGYADKDKNQALRIRNEPFVVNEKKIRQNVFDYGLTGETFSRLHPAPFPTRLAKDQIISWSNPYDIVLDIFSGSGTTCLAAEMLGRKWIGIDISEKYCAIAEKRIDLYKRQGKLEL